MAREAAPYTTYCTEDGWAMLSTYISGRRVRKALGVRFDSPDGRSEEHDRCVREAAAEAYAALIQGRILKPAPEARVQTGATLAELQAMFLVEDKRLYPATGKQHIHLDHFEDFAADDFRGFKKKDTTPKWKGDKRTPLERLAADDGPTEYVRERLRVVLKKTIKKETTTLYRFFHWLKQHGYILSIPPKPEFPRKAIGVRAGHQRATPVQATHEELLRIIAALPEWTSRGGRVHNKEADRAIAVRDVARLAYETGLRPSTLARLRIPDHYTLGEARLWIPPEIDKGKGEARYVRLSEIATVLMKKHAERAIELGRDVVFGAHELRIQWKRAAATVLPPEKAERFAPYDFRHGAGRRMVDVSGGNLLGVAHQLGHTQLTTTNKYLKPDEQHGDAVVEALDEAGRKKKRKPKKKDP